MQMCTVVDCGIQVLSTLRIVYWYQYRYSKVRPSAS